MGASERRRGGGEVVTTRARRDQGIEGRCGTKGLRPEARPGARKSHGRQASSFDDGENESVIDD